MNKQLISLVTQQSLGLQEGVGGCGSGTSTASTPDNNPKMADQRSLTSSLGPAGIGIVGS